MRKIVDKISNWLVSFGIETYLHILCTMIIAAIIARVCVFTGAERSLGCILGAMAGLIIGFIKEIYDNKSTGVFEGKDILANLIGTVLFVLIFI